MTVKEARESVGLSQQKLSDWLGIPKRTIENWGNRYQKTFRMGGKTCSRKNIIL